MQKLLTRLVDAVAAGELDLRRPDAATKLETRFSNPEIYRSTKRNAALGSGDKSRELLALLVAENAKLRNQAVELALQIQELGEQGLR
jgi:hypothetical protein